MGGRCIASADQRRPHSGEGEGQTTDNRRDTAKTSCSTTICVHTKACSVILDGFTRIDLLILLLCFGEQW